MFRRLVPFGRGLLLICTSVNLYLMEYGLPQGLVSSALAAVAIMGGLA
jgi:hypothetical protein